MNVCVRACVCLYVCVCAYGRNWCMSGIELVGNTSRLQWRTFSHTHVCVCVRARAHVCVRACVCACVCVWGGVCENVAADLVRLSTFVALCDRSQNHSS